MPAGDRLGLVLRTALIMAAMTALIAALGMVPMAKAVGGFLIAPVVSGLLGILVWGERPTAPRLVGSAISVAGAALLHAGPRPGSSPARCWRSLGGALLGAYLAATRGARERRRPALDAGGAVAARRGAARALRPRRRLPTPSPALGRRARWRSARISAACHGLTVAAYRRAEATALAPFLYFNLLTAAAVGFLWFGETLGLVEPRRPARRSPPAGW